MNDAPYQLIVRTNQMSGLGIWLSGVVLVAIGGLLLVVCFASLSGVSMHPVLWLVALGMLGGGLWVLRRAQMARRDGPSVVLTADVVGVWVGQRARRTDWSALHRIEVLQIGHPAKRFLHFVRSRADLGGQHTTLGRKIGKAVRDRNISLAHVDLSEADILDGLSRAAQTAGYRLIPYERNTVYEVVCVSDADR